MTNVTTQTTMRELLARWAELESGRCEPYLGRFRIYSKESRLKENWETIDPTNVNQLDLAWIQWAVQQAIVARGLAFELSYYSVLDNYDAEIDIDSHRSICREGSNPAEALLATYLETFRYFK